jgi:hypothetical protein
MPNKNPNQSGLNRSGRTPKGYERLEIKGPPEVLAAYKANCDRLRVQYSETAIGLMQRWIDGQNQLQAQEQSTMNNLEWVATLKKGDRVTYAYGGTASSHPPCHATIVKRGKSFVEVSVDEFSPDARSRFNKAGLQRFQSMSYFLFLAPIEDYDRISARAAAIKASIDADKAKYDRP